MRFCSLGSGSTGNATLIEAGPAAQPTRVLVDCGFTARELDLRLARRGVAVEALDAIFITHEHGDHVGCAVTVARRHRVPLWTTHGTWRAIGAPPIEPGLLHWARDGDAIDIGALRLAPYTVPHDAAEPLQLTASDGARKLGLLTDAGSVTPHMRDALQACEALLIECNHDRGMLAGSAYPWSLKVRVGGPLGHLDNDSAAALLAHCRHGRLQHVVAAHLSQQNNLPALAAQALAEALAASPQDVVVADARTGFDWLGIA